MASFPRDAEGRKKAHAAMQAAAPDLMAEIASIRQAFPGARMTHFKAPGIEYGDAARSGFVIPEGIEVSLEQKRAAEKAAIEAEKRRSSKSKTRRGR